MTSLELGWTCFLLRWKLRFWMLKYLPDVVWYRGRKYYRKQSWLDTHDWRTALKHPFGVTFKTFNREISGEA